jgi:hypothetical protein
MASKRERAAPSECPTVVTDLVPYVLMPVVTAARTASAVLFSM